MMWHMSGDEWHDWDAWWCSIEDSCETGWHKKSVKSFQTTKV